MKLNKNNYIVLILALISLILLFLVLKYSNFLFKNGYYTECFNPNMALYKDTGSPSTSHTVNLPLTTTYSCQNFCAPATARCVITGTQCMADLDCGGCNPYGPAFNETTANVPGENDAGKLTWGVTPTYSTLTTDIGTQAKLFTSNKNKLDKPAMADFGINTWITGFNGGEKLFDERYKPAGLQFMPDYQKRYSVTGQFLTDGPLASNAYLH
jgi:hypothetical protein